jgi:dimethylargininase
VIVEMDRLFDLAFVRPPADSYVDCVSTNPDKSKIDVNLARQQHREYVSILKECGVKVVELRPLEAFPDSVFIQDPALLGLRRAVIGRFGEWKRRGEEKTLVDELSQRRDELGQMRFVVPPGTLEGGDIVVTDLGIFVGESSRTNSAGITQLTSHLSGAMVVPVKTDLFHLLCGCSYLTNRDMIIAPELVDLGPFPGFRFITIPKEEAYACDALYVGERRVMIPSGFPKAATKLRGAGYEPIEVEMSEFHKGDGGVTCISSPVYKLF